MNRKPTIQDVADRAGVGRSTVSRVLNNHPYISDNAREKVLRAMAELDYRPSFAARHMRTSRSRLIGFISDEVLTAPYAGDIIRGAQETTWEKGFVLLSIIAGQDFKNAAAAVEAMLQREVEGIVYAAMYHREVTLPPNISQTPLVLADCFSGNHSVPSVVPDEFEAGKTATETLIDTGHERIGFINVNTLESRLPAAIGRLEGYEAAFQEHSIPFDENLVRFGTGTSEGGFAYTLEFLRMPSPPTAIFCGNDRTAMGAYDAIREHGLRIPDDISVMGFDNQIIIAEALRPSLSTMELPHYAMGQWAVNYLIEVADRDEPLRPVQHKLPCPYVQRRSINGAR